MASLADMIRQNKMRPIDQNPLLGKVSSVLGSAREYGNKVNLPMLGGLGDMFVGKAPEEIENWSYGNSPFQSTEMGLPQIKRERKQSLVDALSTLAGPVSGLAKATEELPVGMSIKNVANKNLNAELLQKYLSTGKLSPQEMAQYEANGVAMETPNLQRYNVENANAQGGTFESRAKQRGYDPEDIYSTNSVDEWLPLIKKKEDVGNYGGMFDGIFLLNELEGGARGYKYNHQFIANPEKVAGHYDKDLDYKKTMKFLKKEYGHELDKDELSRLYDLTAYDEDLWDGGQNVLSKLNDEYDDLGRASWEAQNIRGKLAKNQGFDLIKMRDEEGTSYFAPYGSKIKSTLAAFDPLRKNSSSLLASLVGGIGLANQYDKEKKLRDMQ